MGILRCGKSVVLASTAVIGSTGPYDDEYCDDGECQMCAVSSGIDFTV